MSTSNPVANVPKSASVWKHDLSLGGAGLVLVSLRLLEFAHGAAKEIGDVFWFISSIGILASFVGLVMCVISLFTGSGRAAGASGILLYGILAVLFMLK